MVVNLGWGPELSAQACGGCGLRILQGWRGAAQCGICSRSGARGYVHGAAAAELDSTYAGWRGLASIGCDQGKPWQPKRATSTGVAGAEAVCGIPALKARQRQEESDGMR